MKPGHFISCFLHCSLLWVNFSWQRRLVHDLDKSVYHKWKLSWLLGWLLNVQTFVIEWTFRLQLWLPWNGWIFWKNTNKLWHPPPSPNFKKRISSVVKTWFCSDRWPPFHHFPCFSLNPGKGSAVGALQWERESWRKAPATFQIANELDSSSEEKYGTTLHTKNLRLSWKIDLSVWIALKTSSLQCYAAMLIQWGKFCFLTQPKEHSVTTVTFHVAIVSMQLEAACTTRRSKQMKPTKVVNKQSCKQAMTSRDVGRGIGMACQYPNPHPLTSLLAGSASFTRCTCWVISLASVAWR